MKCPKCGGSDFVLESSVITTEIYKIYKNGRVPRHPFKTDITNEDMTDNENIIRCVTCRQGYVLEKYRRELLNETNFNQVDLENEGFATKY